MFKALWDRRVASEEETRRTLETDLSTIERQVEQFLDRIAETDMPSIIAAYEKRIRALEERKLVMSERIANCGRPLADFDDTLKTALGFLASPCQFRHSERLEDKRAVLKLAFAGRLVYTRDEGFKTADTSLPFKVLEDFRKRLVNRILPC
jgi:site-specific DNA recombinase